MVSSASWLLLLGLLSFIPCSELIASHQESFADQCTLVPTWTIHGERAISLVGQNITVIAILNSSRLFGRKQAVMLSSLRTRLYQSGFPNVNFIVINSMMARENTEILKHEVVNITVYQERPEEPVKEILRAENDHILVLDRCGRMAYQIITPFSKLIYPYVKAAILSAYRDDPCGTCTNALNVRNEANRIVLASDAPAYTDDEVSDYHRDDFTQAAPGYNFRVNQVQITSALQMEPPIRDNGLNQLFSQNRAPTFHEEWKTDSETLPGGQINANTGFVRIRAKSDPKQGSNPDKQRSIQDWNVLANQNIEAVSSTEASVEVVRNNVPSKQKKIKIHYLQHQVDVHQPTAVLQNITLSPGGQGNSSKEGLLPDMSTNVRYQDYVDNSMEELVNQTQRLFDWYHQQIENGTSSEEEYEKSNILKVKIIEHYSKLLPWLNYQLNAAVEH